MSEAKHTPLPWRADDLAKIRCTADDGKGLVAGVYGGRYYNSIPATDVDLVVSRANAALIVRAVNNHAELVAALEGFNLRTDMIVGAQGDDIIFRVPRSVITAAAQALARAKVQP